MVLVLAGCGEARPAPAAPSDHSPVDAAPTWVERGNWVAEWTAYVPVVTTTADGKTVSAFAPAPGATQRVRDGDSPSILSPGVREPMKVAMSPIALGPGTIETKVGEVLERNVVQDQLEAVGTLGRSARVYWSRRRRLVQSDNGRFLEVPFSTVFIEGMEPGRTEVFLHYPESVRQTLIINVSARVAP